MPFGVQTEWRREALPKPEILAYPLETNVIDSGVINAAGVTADASGTPYAGRRYLLAGTILSKRGDNQYERFTGAGGQAVAGILFDTVEFADDSDASDEPVAFLRRNASFKADKIVDFATHEAALEAALDTCEFI
jgi:hypothetical protein